VTLSAEKLAACKTDGERFLLGLDALQVELRRHAPIRPSKAIAELKREVDEAMAEHEQAMRDRFPQFSMPGFEPGRTKFVGNAHLQPARREWTCAYCERHVSIGPERTKCPNCGAAEEHAPSRSGGWIVLPRSTNSTGPR
jgi:rubrerythrin